MGPRVEYPFLSAIKEVIGVSVGSYKKCDYVFFVIDLLKDNAIALR